MSARTARRFWAIVPAAGRGERFATAASPGIPKQYTPLSGRSVLEWSLRALLGEPRIQGIVVVLAAGDERWSDVARNLDSPKLLSTVGGAHRQDSVMNGLAYLAPSVQADDWILVHDAARPCLHARDISALCDALEKNPRGGAGKIGAAGEIGTAEEIGGAVLAAPIVDTVKRERASGLETVDRAGLWRALTPQVFAYAQLRKALEDAAREGLAVTDEAQAMERLGIRAVLVPGSPFNIKVTRAEDLEAAAAILKMGESGQMRIGQGVDVHAFGAGDHVVLGGVRITHAQGIVAHSDGDVVIHALCDALLGAMGDGDIGQHFPDSDPRYRGADSRVFLRVVAERMRSAGLRLVNADITVLAEAPRIGAHRSAMAANLAQDLQVAATAINIKATTTERLGFIGRQEGLAAMASVLLSG
jgi:2-C-methyl-D-erythritol 4-phosphate cytidylyltransferase / 2-C-methyl-D-erythritol 2,4-cyclodiphosphate synthase